MENLTPLAPLPLATLENGDHRSLFVRIHPPRLKSFHFYTTRHRLDLPHGTRPQAEAWGTIGR